MEDRPVPEPDDALAAEFLSHLDLIERIVAFVCARHHLSAAEAEDFSSDVKLKMIEGRYAAFASFQRRSSLRTYLSVVIQRMFLDHRVRAWGRWRPSAEARRGGPVAVLLERLLIRDGYAFEEACELLITNHRVGVDRAALAEIAARLPVRSSRKFESDDVLVEQAASDRTADELVTEADRQSTAARVSRAVEALMAKLETQDRLILALRFHDGHSVTEIAAMLRLERQPLYRRVDRLLSDLREGLEAEGIDAATVRQILESPTADLTWPGEGGREVAMTGRSRRRGAHE